MTRTQAEEVEASRICTDWRRNLSTGGWSCQCGCEPMGPDIDTVRRCLKDMADEIDRLRLVEAELARVRAVAEAAREYRAAMADDDFHREGLDELDALYTAIDALTAIDTATTAMRGEEL